MAGGVEVVLVLGESGIGKTRLLDELHREAILRDFRCLRAQAVELERSIPLNPLLDAIGSVDLEPHLAAIGRPWSNVVASLLPAGAVSHSAEDPPPIQPSSLSRRLLDSFALLFEQLAREQPTILFLDDLQWADATTIATLQFLQRRWTRGSFGIFATLRPDLVGAEDPVAKYLTRTSGLRVERIGLVSLHVAEALELVEAIGEGAVDEVQARRLCTISGNHPLYLTELTRDFLAGRFTLPERIADEVTIPTSLGQMLDARLDGMDDRARSAAGVLAVAGRPLRIEDIAAVGGLNLQEAAGAGRAGRHRRRRSALSDASRHRLRRAE
jgi:predicted ATPase